VLAAGVLLFGCRVAFAQFPPAEFSPENPTAADSIRAGFLGYGGCGTTVATSVNGLVVRTTVTYFSCTNIPSYITTFAGFGPLPAGTYTYEIVFVTEGDLVTEGDQQLLRSTQPLVVAPVPNVPMLSSTALAVLLSS
jgi:hypothetical protein